MLKHLILRIIHKWKQPKLSRQNWNRLRATIKRRDKGICVYCGKEAKEGHCDHVLALSKGGRDSADNLVWSCSKCNLEKGVYNLRDWTIKMLGEKTLSKEERHRYIRLINYPKGILGYIKWIEDCPLFR